MEPLRTDEECGCLFRALAVQRCGAAVAFVRKRAFSSFPACASRSTGIFVLYEEKCSRNRRTARWAAAKAANSSERYRTKEKGKGEGEREGKGEEDVYAAHPCPGNRRVLCRARQPGGPQRFVDFYTANGWRLGPNPMRTGRRLCAPGSGGARRRRKPIFAGGCMTRQGSKAADGADPGRRGRLLQRRGRRHPAHGHGPVGRRWSSWTPGTPWRALALWMGEPVPPTAADVWQAAQRLRPQLAARSAPVFHPMQERSDPHESEH